LFLQEVSIVSKFFIWQIDFKPMFNDGEFITTKLVITNTIFNNIYFVIKRSDCTVIGYKGMTPKKRLKTHKKVLFKKLKVKWHPKKLNGTQRVENDTLKKTTKNAILVRFFSWIMQFVSIFCIYPI
jgi:hypothetical protein